MERISAHSHVRGLGLDPQTLTPRGPSSEGLVIATFDTFRPLSRVSTLPMTKNCIKYILSFRLVKTEQGDLLD